MNIDEIRKILNKFPKVKWDRYTEDGLVSNFFGWIKRKDGQSDFLILSFVDKKLWWYFTSSAKFSKKIAKKLKQKHLECTRVEDLFGKKVKCIHLKENE